MASDLPETIDFLASTIVQQSYHARTELCGTMDVAEARQHPLHRWPMPSALPPPLAPIELMAWQPWKVHTFNATAYADTHRAEADELDAITGEVHAWGDPSKPGWWGPGPLWAALVDLYTLAALNPAVFVGSAQSTFSEAALVLAVALADTDVADRMWATDSSCIVPPHTPTALALHGLLGLPGNNHIIPSNTTVAPCS